MCFRHGHNKKLRGKDYKYRADQEIKHLSFIINDLISFGKNVEIMEITHHITWILAIFHPRNKFFHDVGSFVDVMLYFIQVLIVKML